MAAPLVYECDGYRYCKDMERVGVAESNIEHPTYSCRGKRRYCNGEIILQDREVVARGQDHNHPAPRESQGLSIFVRIDDKDIYIDGNGHRYVKSKSIGTHGSTRYVCVQRHEMCPVKIELDKKGGIGSTRGTHNHHPKKSALTRKWSKDSSQKRMKFSKISDQSNETHDQFIVEEIWGQRWNERDGCPEYCVKWKGYPPTEEEGGLTWEKETQFSDFENGETIVSKPFQAWIRRYPKHKFKPINFTGLKLLDMESKRLRLVGVGEERERRLLDKCVNSTPVMHSTPTPVSCSHPSIRPGPEGLQPVVSPILNPSKIRNAKKSVRSGCSGPVAPVVFCQTPPVPVRVKSTSPKKRNRKSFEAQADSSVDVEPSRMPDEPMASAVHGEDITPVLKSFNPPVASEDEAQCTSKPPEGPSQVHSEGPSQVHSEGPSQVHSEGPSQVHSEGPKPASRESSLGTPCLDCVSLNMDGTSEAGSHCFRSASYNQTNDASKSNTNILLTDPEQKMPNVARLQRIELSLCQPFANINSNDLDTQMQLQFMETQGDSEGIFSYFRDPCSDEQCTDTKRLHQLLQLRQYANIEQIHSVWQRLTINSDLENDRAVMKSVWKCSGDITLLMKIVWSPLVVVGARNRSIYECEEVQLSEEEVSRWVGAVEFVVSRCTPAMINTPTKNGWTALMIAVKTAPFAIVKLLIESGAHVNVEDVNKNNLLHICTLRGDPKLVHYLLKCGVNLNGTEKAANLVPSKFHSNCHAFADFCEEYNMFLVVHINGWIRDSVKQKTMAPLAPPAQFSLRHLAEEGMIIWRIFIEELIADRSNLLLVFIAKREGHRLVLSSCPEELLFYNNFFPLAPLQNDGNNRIVLPFFHSYSGVNYVRIIWNHSKVPLVNMESLKDYFIILRPYKCL